MINIRYCMMFVHAMLFGCHLVLLEKNGITTFDIVMMPTHLICYFMHICKLNAPEVKPNETEN